MCQNMQILHIFITPPTNIILQDTVVKKMLELGADVNQTSNTGELPLSRNLASITAEVGARGSRKTLTKWYN